MASLSFYTNERELFRYPLRPGRNVLGRSDRCDLALPDDSVSRKHCALERRAAGWWLIDRSRHGTAVNGTRVDDACLKHGDILQIGSFKARFEDDVAKGGTETSPLPKVQDHKELLDADSREVVDGYAALRGTRGPGTDKLIPLDKGLLTLGGDSGDDIVLDELPKSAFALRVVRGRVMIEPRHDVPVFVAGSLAPSLMPVLTGEEIRCGPHGLVVEFEVRATRAQRDHFGEMVGTTPLMRHVFASLDRIARVAHPVLLVGESGTGKELAAQAVHQCSPRAGGPFVAINCASLPENLVESELFGHEKGSFTGATVRQDGAFQRADRGTLFLDEVGELRLEDQAKLLRALESGEVRRVGGATAELPDVRVIAATNRDLTSMVGNGTFREDLYFRLSVLTVELPPLRARSQDIPAITHKLLSDLFPGAQVSEAALKRLQKHPWPGNVRELRNVLTRAYVLAGPHIDTDGLSFAAGMGGLDVVMEADPLSRSALIDALQRARGNRSKAAQMLGLPRSSLLYRLKKLGIS